MSSLLTQAITHIRLQEANRGKLAALDALWVEYKALCQTYVTHFCTVVAPDEYATLEYPSSLSARWQRVAVQQAAGMAQSWRTKRRRAADEYLAKLAWYEGLPKEQQANHKRPRWKEWNTPELKATCIQANVNVVRALTADEAMAALELSESESATFDYWLKVSTLQKGSPIYLPVKLAAYHRSKLKGFTSNRSVCLNRRKDGWWLTFSIDVPAPEVIPAKRAVGGDMGISNFLTSSTGKHYGSFQGDLAARHQRDRAKRSRKAKLRACLEKKGVQNLPSTSSASGQRLSRHVRQSINRAINEFLDDCPDTTIVLERLSVASMGFKARRMNAYLYASNLGHVKEQLPWAAAKRGIEVVCVNPAYSSQECPHCHFPDRANRPTQQTFCCVVCGFTGHADQVGATNIVNRLNDSELAACRSLEQVKALLLRRHAHWKAHHGYS